MQTYTLVPIALLGALGCSSASAPSKPTTAAPPDHNDCVGGAVADLGVDAMFEGLPPGPNGLGHVGYKLRFSHKKKGEFRTTYQAVLSNDLGEPLEISRAASPLHLPEGKQVTSPPHLVSNVGDGFYRVAVTAAATDGRSDITATTDAFVEIANGSSREISGDEWHKRSQARVAHQISPNEVGRAIAAPGQRGVQ